MEFIRLQEELRKTNAELSSANAALRENEEKLEQRVEERTHQLTTLLRVSHNITTTLDLEPLLGLILDQLQEVVDYRLASISYLENEDELLILAVRGEGIQPPGTRIRLSEHMNTRNMLDKREPAFVPDLNANTPLAERMRHNLAEQNLSGLGSWMSAPLVFRDKSIGVLALAHPGTNYYNPARVELAMAFANQAAAAITHARLFAMEQRRGEQFRVISEAGRRITSILSLHQLLVETARTVRESFGYHHVHIGMVEGDMIVFKTMGAEAPGDVLFANCEAMRLRVGEEGLCGWAVAMGEAVLAQDVRKDPRFVSAKDDPTLSEAVIPIKLRESVIGVLEAESNRVNGFDDNDLLVLQSMADQLAVAIENARLYEQARQFAALEERQKLARELHDSVSQALYGIVLGARTARTLLERDPIQATQPLDYILSLSEAGLAEMRALIFELRPESLQTDGLVVALDRLVSATGARHQLEIQMDAGDEPDVPIEIKESLYRITQEALNNIVKHARAKRVEVKLGNMNGQLLLNISDDGMGFDLTQSFPGHLGLHSMRERAEKVGGIFKIETAPNLGTRIQVSVPI